MSIDLRQTNVVSDVTIRWNRSPSGYSKKDINETWSRSGYLVAGWWSQRGCFTGVLAPSMKSKILKNFYAGRTKQYLYGVCFAESCFLKLISYGWLITSGRRVVNLPYSLALKYLSLLFKFFSFAYYDINFWFKISKVCPKISHFSQTSHSRGNTDTSRLHLCTGAQA